MSTWLFDLGNTRLKCAPLHPDGSRGEVLAISHRDTGLAAALAQVLPARIDVAYVASVVDAPLRVALIEALGEHCERITLARTQARFGPLRIAYAQPHSLGVDRFLAMLAAHAHAKGAALVCGVGTALTIDLVRQDGGHVGGRIAPSPTTMRDALHDRAPHLPAQGGTYREFAASTGDALAAGCLGAALGLIERSLDVAARELGDAPALYLHGGGAEALLAGLSGAVHVPGLVLDGLAMWAAAEWPH